MLKRKKKFQLLAQPPASLGLLKQNLE